MADVLTTAQRSYNMSQIRSEKTGPEIQLQTLLISNGVKGFLMQPKNILGKPDFYFPDRKTAVFLDGCFWHGCESCFQSPKTNKKFWNSKIESNIKRDKTVNKKLASLGITVIRVKEHELEKNPADVLGLIEKKLPEDFRPKVLDLFAGAGGFSEGFISAGSDMVAHVEMDKDACETIRTRMVYHALKKIGRLDEYEKYLLGKINRSELVKKYGLQKELDSAIHARIDKNNYSDLIEQVKQKLNGKKLDIIIGGPPCQAYSHIGRASDKKHMRRDERKFLYVHYVEFLKALKPKIFIFENVPGLLSAGKGIYLRKMRQLMKKAGYTTDFRILNAADYGVPQERKRVILIGWNKESSMKSYPEISRITRDYKLADFLGDLPKLKAGRGKSRIKFESKSDLLSRLGIVTGIKTLPDHISRPHRKHDLEIYKLAVAYKNDGHNIKYNEIPKHLRTHKNQTGFLDRFKVVDFSAANSHTVIAHIAKDGHYYIHPDAKQNRSLTVREAARIQTFPDDFLFEGSRTSQYRQIGNAVPPMLSKIIAETILRFI